MRNVQEDRKRELYKRGYLPVGTHYYRIGGFGRRVVTQVFNNEDRTHLLFTLRRKK